MGHIRGFIAIVCLLCVCSTSMVCAQDRFSIEFKDTPLSSVLEMLKRYDKNLQFAMSGNLGDIKVTASLVEVTVDEALQIVLSQAGLMSVKDAGVYQIREKPERRTERGERPTPRFPAPVFMNRPTAPGATTDVAAAAAPGAAAATTAAADEEKNLPLRLIIMKYADPADMADLFGGEIIEGGGLYGGGGGGGGNSGGGYGGSSGSSGSSRGGSSGSSRGGSSGSSRSSGSSGSSRGGSSRSSSNY
ncbi:MAG: STN domain-containing protein [Armatimonadia bacterium]